MANTMKKWPTVVLFGDSLTQFSFSYDGGWGALIADKLQRKCDVICRGFSGYNSRWCKTLLPRIFNEEYAKNVAVVTIFLGANDSNFKELNPKQHVPLDEFKENIMDMVKFLQSVGITKEKIIIIGPPPTDLEEWGKVLAARDPPTVIAKCNKQTSQYSIACQTAAEECDVTFVELFNAMQGQELTQPTCNCDTCTTTSSPKNISPHSSNNTESEEKDEISPHSSNNTESEEKDEVPDDVISIGSSEDIMQEDEDTSTIHTTPVQDTAPWVNTEETTNSTLSRTELEEFFKKKLNKKRKKFNRQILFKIEQQFRRFVQSKENTFLKDCHTFGKKNAYIQMLVHRTADLYKLDHRFLPKKNSILVKKTASTEIPRFRFEDLIDDKSSTEDSSDDSQQLKRSNEQEKTEQKEEESLHTSLTDDQIPPWLSQDSQKEKIQNDLSTELDFFKSVLNKGPQQQQLLLSYEEQFIRLIKNPRTYNYKFGEMSSYNRMLVHRVAELFGLHHYLEKNTKKIVVRKTPLSQIPEFRFQDHIPEQVSKTVSTRKDTRKTKGSVQCKETLKSKLEIRGKSEKTWKGMFCDGLHFSRPGSEFVANKLWPVIDQKTSHLPMLLPLWSDVDNNNPEESLLK